MNEAEQYVATRLAEGWQQEAIVGQLVAAGWAPGHAAGLVGRFTPPAHPADGQSTPTAVGRTWLLVVALCAAALSMLVIAAFVVMTVAGNEGPRQLLAALDQGLRGAAGPVQIASALWVIALVALILHRTVPRPPAAEPAARSTANPRSTRALRGWCLALLIGGPVLSVGGLLVMVVVWVALGVMCGEAVTQSCGL